MFNLSQHYQWVLFHVNDLSAMLVTKELEQVNNDQRKMVQFKTLFYS